MELYTTLGCVAFPVRINVPWMLRNVIDEILVLITVEKIRFMVTHIFRVKGLRVVIN